MRYTAWCIIIVVIHLRRLLVAAFARSTVVNDFDNRAERSGIVRNDEPTMPSRCTNVEREMKE